MFHIPKGRKSEKLNSKLNLTPLLTLQKHPSAKNLLDREGKPISKEESNNNIEYNNILINSQLNNEENSNSNNEMKYEIFINFSNVENPLFTNNDYSIKNEDISLIKNIKNNNNQKKTNNSIFDFSDFQKILDQEITMDIVNGKGFPSIEEKLSNFLKD